MGTNNFEADKTKETAAESGKFQYPRIRQEEEETMNKYDAQTAADSGNVTATAQNILDKGTEAYGKAEKVAGEAYDKSTQKVKETYEKAKIYSEKNPGNAILIALGVGVGIGLLLSASSSHRSRTGRIAQPVINALSEIARDFTLKRH